MTPEQVGAHFEAMRLNLNFSLVIAAIVGLLWATIKGRFLQALAIGITTLAGVVIYLNGWPYFRVFFFGDAYWFAIRTGVVSATLIVAALAGLGLRRLARRGA